MHHTPRSHVSTVDIGQYGQATLLPAQKKRTSRSWQFEIGYFFSLRSMAVDGYGAPRTSGIFIDLVKCGFYNGIQRPTTALSCRLETSWATQTALSKQAARQSATVKTANDSNRSIFSVKGDKGPSYESTIEDEGHGGQANSAVPVCRFSHYVMFTLPAKKPSN